MLSFLVITMTLIYIILLFFCSQAYLMKSKLSKNYQIIKFRYFLLAAFLFISVSAIVGQWIGLGNFFVLTSSVLSSSILVYRFQDKYEKMESGRE